MVFLNQYGKRIQVNGQIIIAHLSYINNHDFSCFFMQWFYQFLLDQCNNLLVWMVELHMLWNLFPSLTCRQHDTTEEQCKCRQIHTGAGIWNIMYQKKATNFARWWNIQSLRLLNILINSLKKGWFQPFVSHRCVSKWA